MVFDAKDQYPSQWAAIESIASKIGCTGETLRKWVRQGERDSGVRPGSGPTTFEQQRIKELEREARELRKTNEVKDPTGQPYLRRLALGDQFRTLSDAIRPAL